MTVTCPRRALRLLSYASQDAEAARRICEALRAADIEVWIDQSALRGGDAWDASIRKQIKACALFIPVISANTHARVEGYFRLEWKLAVDRSHLIAADQPFLLPVVIDGTPQTDERIPERFRELQWTNLAGGETPAAFVARVSRLLLQSERTGAASPAPDRWREPYAVAQRPDDASAPMVSRSVWARIKDHKVLQWTLAYAAAAYTLLHVVEMVGSAFDWPHLVARVATLLLVLGAPLATTLAWYHGHRAQHRVSGPELTIITVLLVIAGSVLWWIGRASHERALPQSVASAPVMTSGTPTTPTEKSIAVLPFVDMSEKHDQGYFSDGLSEELIDMLTKVSDLRVPARTSSFYFKGKSEDIATIAQRLRVANVLEGSVRKAGNTLRVTAQLIRADNGYHLWSESYDRELKDVFKVQDDIAGAVVTALKAHLLPTQVEAEGGLHTANVEAYKQYLQGKQSFNSGDPLGYQRAVTAFQTAVALDPRYAAAHAALALAQFWLADANDDEAGYQSALASAERAVALAPGLAEGYAVRGFLRANRFNFAGGKADLDKAVALRQGDADVLHRSAVVLGALGNLSAAIAREQKALELDPLSAEICMRLGFFFSADRQFAKARSMFEKALTIAPNSVRARFHLGNLDLLEGRNEEALVSFAQTEIPVWRLLGQAMAEYSLGRNEASRQALEQLIARYSKTDPSTIARFYAWRGEKTQAFEWAERAYASRDNGLFWIKIDPPFRSLYGDPRFNALLRKMNLPD